MSRFDVLSKSKRIKTLPYKPIGILMISFPANQNIELVVSEEGRTYFFNGFLFHTTYLLICTRNEVEVRRTKEVKSPHFLIVTSHIYVLENV